MNQNVEFLNYIYQNSKMGIETIEQLIDIVEDPEFFKQLRSQLSDYEEINKEAEIMINDSGNVEKDVSKLTKITSYMMISLKTLTNDSINNIAEMMIEGSNKGIIEMTKHMNDYVDVDEKIKALAKKLVKTEEENIKSLKKFL